MTGKELRLNRLGAILCMVVSFAMLSDAHARNFDERYWFRVEAEALGPALEAFVSLTKIQLILPHDLATRTGVNPVIGYYTIQEALDVLLKDTEFSGGLTKSGVIVISLDNKQRPESPEADVDKNLKKSLLAGISAAIFGSGSAVGQPQTAPSLEEIVVTARKRAESMQRVPVAVTAISENQLRENLAADLHRVAEIAPQLLIGEFGSGTGAVLTMRGIGSDAIDFGLDQSVLVVIDGVPISNGSVIRQSLFDMRQVEVMPGPQALFFGKNATAGVISLKTAEPTDQFEGHVSAGYEFVADEKYGEAVISGPLTDTVRARFAGRASSMDGWIKNVAQPMESPFHPGVWLPGNVNRTSPKGTHYAGRLSLQWEPSDTFDANLSLSFDEQKIDGNGNLAFHEAWCTSGADAPLTQGIPQIGADCKKNRRVAVSANAPQFAANFPYANNGVPYRDNRFLLGALNLNKQFENVILTSTTGFYDQNHKGANCSDGAYCQLFSTIRTDYEQFTQEFRLNTDFDSPVNFMGAVYYERHERSWFTAVDFFHLGINPATNNYATWINEADGKYTGYSISGQVRWNIIPELELAVGARYSRDKKSSHLSNTAVSPFSPLALYPEGEIIGVNIKDDNISPEATLTWYPSDYQTLYAAYKTGYKSGGISNPSIIFAASTPESLQFGSEKAKGFEVGYKADFLDRTLRLNITAYRYEFDDLQVVSEDINVFLFTIGNAGSSKTEGIETSLLWQATDRLSFNGSFNYNRASYLNYRGAECYAGQTPAQGCVDGAQNLSGKPISRAPRDNYSLGASYRFDLVEGWNLNTSVSATYTSSYHASTTNNPGAMQSSFWRVNAAAHLAPESEKFRISLIGRNLTNEYYHAAASNLPFGGPNDFLAPFNRPRELALQVEYHF